MRSLICLAVVCAFIAMPAFADPTPAGTGRITRVPTYYAGSGGEFTIYDHSLYVGAYGADALGKGAGSNSFQTFCLEKGEYTANDLLNLGISEEFKDGSAGSHALKGGAEFPGDTVFDGDDLDSRTAYLYTLFATGNLTDGGTNAYDYTGSTRNNSAGALQNLIWTIENEVTIVNDSDYFDKDLETAWLAMANTEVGTIGSAFYEDVSDSSNLIRGIGDVRVLRLTQNGVDKQDQLFLTPVPGAILLGMLGFSVAGIKLRKYA